MKKQDQSLAILADGVDRLDDMARGIGDEIKQQDAYFFWDCFIGSLLDNLDTDVTDANNRLTQARDKMQKLMKTNSMNRKNLLWLDKCEFYTIIILFVVALIMGFALLG